MAVEIIGGLTGSKADVDSTTLAMLVKPMGATGPLTFLNGADVRTKEGMLNAGQNDGVARILRTDRFGSVSVATQTPLYWEPYEGTTISTNRNIATATTMAAAQTALGLTINSGAITTLNTGYVLASRKMFPRILRAPLQFRTRARVIPYNGAVIEFGFGSGNSATVSPTVGAYFQVTSGGIFQAVMTYNGVDTTTALSGFSNDSSKYYTFDILLDDDGATFIIQDTSTGLFLTEVNITLPLTQGRLANVTHTPCFHSVRNTASAPSTAPQMIVTDTYIGLLDCNLNSAWMVRSAQMGLGANYGPVAFTQTSNNANSTAPSNATLSNTAAGYTTLGGRFGFAAVAGAATDYALFNYAVPSPYQLTCTGIDIEAYNTGAAVATTPTLLDWSIGVNGLTTNLATGGHIRDYLGAQQFVVGAAIGAKAERISIKFDTPLVCEAGLSFTIILRMPVGTATASQVIQGGIKVHGYFE